MLETQWIPIATMVILSRCFRNFHINMQEGWATSATGLKPDYCWELPSNANVYAFDAEKSSAAAKGAGEAFSREPSRKMEERFVVTSINFI